MLQIAGLPIPRRPGRDRGDGTDRQAHLEDATGTPGTLEIASMSADFAAQKLDHRLIRTSGYASVTDNQYTE